MVRHRIWTKSGSLLCMQATAKAKPMRLALSVGAFAEDSSDENRPTLILRARYRPFGQLSLVLHRVRPSPWCEKKGID